MYYPYCTIQESIEVVHTPLKNGYTVVHFEKPDSRYRGKNTDMLCCIFGTVPRDWELEEE